MLSWPSCAHITLTWTRGQGYDNGSNMKGKNIGFQRIILDQFNRAFFVPCSLHSLNLFLVDADKCSGEIISYFGIVQELFNFFSSSTNRWAKLQEHAETAKSIVLKNMSDTSWPSRANALKWVNKHLPQIYDALIDIHSSTTDADTRHLSSALAEKNFSFKFIFSTQIWYEVLSKINIVSKTLQSKKNDITVCLEQISMLREFFPHTDEMVLIKL